MKKHQTTLSDEIEQKIICRLFALGMSYADASIKGFEGQWGENLR